MGTEQKKPDMVDWYSPGQLAKTGVSTAISGLLGASMDNRRIIALAGNRSDSVIDYSDPDTFTFDYIADTGDGWDSTYTMAYLLTAPSLSVKGAAGDLDRADAVVIGGDAVYPVASKEAYAKRLVWPFNQAARDIRDGPPVIKSLPRRDIFLIPGNHDWYDSLGSMSRRFFASRSSGKLKTRPLGQFDTCQVRSYFIIKLPHNWEIWAVDIQLGADIDPEQYAFFRDHADTMSSETRVVFCTAEPTIVYGESVEMTKPDLVFGLKRIRRLAYNRGARVLVQLAGDVHNYEHYVVEKTTKQDTAYERHQFVCGGGGAFLHPTHSFNPGSKENPRIETVARYPDAKTSRRLSWGNLGFAFRHKGMSALLGVVYALLFWSSGLIRDPVYYVIAHPGSAVLMLVALVGFTMFASRKKLWGFVHGVAHVALAIFCWWLAAKLAVLPFPWLPVEIQIRILVFVLGAVLGGTLFGLYLVMSLNVFRMHHNEAFSALESPHYKSFLRCTVAADGSLTIRTIAVPKTTAAGTGHPVDTELVEEVHITR